MVTNANRRLVVNKEVVTNLMAIGKLTPERGENILIRIKCVRVCINQLMIGETLCTLVRISNHIIITGSTSPRCILFEKKSLA